MEGNLFFQWKLFIDSSSSLSGKSYIWNDSYNEAIIESEFKNNLTKQEKFILLYKYRYEKENKAL